MAAIPATRKRAPLVTVPGYAIDVFALTSQQKLLLANLASRIKTRLEVDKSIWVDVDVEGHTDSTGKEQHNEKLGMDRATAVAEFLRSLLKDDFRDRVNYQVRSASFREPIASNHTEATRSKNRRVELRMEWVAPPPPSPDRPKPKPRKPKPLVIQLPALDTKPCRDLKDLEVKFGFYLQKLGKVISSTTLDWEGPGNPITLTPTNRKTLTETLTSIATKEVTDAVMDKGQDAVLKNVPFQPPWWTVYVEQLSQLRQDEKNERIMNRTLEDERAKTQRKLVAAAVAEDTLGPRADFVKRKELYIYLFQTWEKYLDQQELCDESRGKANEPKGYWPAPQ